MNIINAEHIITQTWGQFFGHWGIISREQRAGLALLFNVEVSIRNHGFEKDGNTYHEEWERRFFERLEYVVTARHEVFVRVNGGEWFNTSNHDTCWYSDGLRDIRESLDRGWEHCYNNIPDEHQRSMREMYHHCTINSGILSQNMVQFARVSTEQGEGYRRKLTMVKPIKFQIQFQE